MLCTEIVSDIFVRNMFSPCSAKRRASDKDLPAFQFFMKKSGHVLDLNILCSCLKKKLVPTNCADFISHTSKVLLASTFYVM